MLIIYLVATNYVINDISNWYSISYYLSINRSIYIPYQSTGSLLTLNGKIIGSKLIAQEFKSAKFFHTRPPTDSASTVDPHITPENAFTQVSNVSKATGIPHNALETLINLNIERNKITNGLFFAPQYVNVLEVNLDLVKQYPEHYQEFLNNLNRR